MVFSHPGPTFLQQPAAAAASSQQQRVASSHEAARTQHPGTSLVYRAVSDDTLGSFWSLFPGPSVLQCHGVFPSGPTFLQQPAAGAASSQQQRVASSHEAGSRQPVVSSQISASSQEAGSRQPVVSSQDSASGG